jgi:hypothetical protein
MASDDKTYCGRGESPEMRREIDDLAERLAISRQDVLDVMDQVGSSLDAVEAYFLSKQNSY